MNRILSIFVFSVLCTGCSFLNPLLTEVAFRDYAEKSIGQNVDEFTKYEWRNPIKVISLNNGQTEYHLEHKYHSSQSGRDYKCTWALITDNESKKILSWHYISEPSACMSKYFYEGAF